MTQCNYLLSREEGANPQRFDLQTVFKYYLTNLYSPKDYSLFRDHTLSTLCLNLSCNICDLNDTSLRLTGWPESHPNVSTQQTEFLKLCEWWEG